MLMAAKEKLKKAIVKTSTGQFENKNLIQRSTRRHEFKDPIYWEYRCKEKLSELFAIPPSNPNGPQNVIPESCHYIPDIPEYTCGIFRKSSNFNTL